MGPLAEGAGGRLPQDMKLVRRIAGQAGVGLDGVKIEIRLYVPGRRAAGLPRGQAVPVPLRLGWKVDVAAACGARLPGLVAQPARRVFQISSLGQLWAQSAETWG